MNDDTVAYQRALPPTWKQRTEAILERIGDAYFATWDIMYAIAAGAYLLWWLNLITR